MNENEKVKGKSVMEYKAQSGDIIRIDPQMVRDFLIQGKRELITVQEIFYFMQMCKARRLNPFVKDCYLIKYGSEPASIITSVDYFRKNARKADDCRGWQCGVIVQRGKEIELRDGSLLLDGEVLVGGWAHAKPRGWEDRKNHTVNLAPYIKRKRDGSATPFWTEEKQPDMIMKVAEVQLLRQIWGEESTGMYVPEEMPSLEDIESEALPTRLGEMQSDTVKRLKPESKPEPESKPKPEPQSPIQSYPMTQEEVEPEPVPKEVEPERKRIETGQFPESIREPTPKPDEQMESATEIVLVKPDGIPPEWNRDVWSRKKTSGFTTHVWANLKTMPDVLEGEVRQKWYKLHGHEVPFPKDAKPEQSKPEPEPEQSEEAEANIGMITFHDPGDFDEMGELVQNVYLNLADLNHCDVCEVNPKDVNRVLKTKYAEKWEAVRIELKFGMIPTSPAAADIWNSAIGVRLDKMDPIVSQPTATDGPI